MVRLKGAGLARPIYIATALVELSLAESSDQEELDDIREELAERRNQCCMGHGKPVVYVVDDEKVIAETLAMILRQAGFTAFAFADPKQALAAAESNSPPDLLISDVAMPGMSGIELAIAFEETYPECKVLLFSGQATTANLLEIARSQGHDFEVLSKPVHPADLLARVRDYRLSDEKEQSRARGLANRN